MQLETITCGNKSKGICNHKMNGECKNCLADLDPLHHSVDECNDYQEGIRPIVNLYTTAIKNIEKPKEQEIVPYLPQSPNL